MSDQYDGFWNRLVGDWQRSRGLNRQTSDEADAAFQNAPEVPLSSQDIEATIGSVLSGELATWDTCPDFDRVPESSNLSREAFRSRTEDSPDDADRQDMLDELKRRLSSDEKEPRDTEDSERPNAD